MHSSRLTNSSAYEPATTRPGDPSLPSGSRNVVFDEFVPGAAARRPYDGHGPAPDSWDDQIGRRVDDSIGFQIGRVQCSGEIGDREHHRQDLCDAVARITVSTTFSFGRDFHVYGSTRVSSPTK